MESRTDKIRCWSCLLIFTGSYINALHICWYNTIHCVSFRSTPVETLHTILLGPYKYMLQSLMGRLNAAQKEEIEARVNSFNFSGFENKLSYSVCRHYRSFVGRDFKTMAGCSLFILGPYMLPNEKIIWISLSKVFYVNL